MSSEGAATSNSELSAIGAELRRTWTAVSIALTAASIWALIVRTWDIDLSTLMQAIVDAYQTIFHRLIETLFGWLPFKLSAFAKDLMVIWFAVGTSLARTFFFLFETGSGRGVAKWSSPLFNRQTDDVIFNTPVLRTLLLLAAVVFWPLAMVLLLRKPKLCFSKGGQKYATRRGRGGHSNIRRGRASIHRKARSSPGVHSVLAVGRCVCRRI